MKMKRYKITYTVSGFDYNIRHVKASDIGTALQEFVASFPEATISEMIEV